MNDFEILMLLRFDCWKAKAGLPRRWGVVPVRTPTLKSESVRNTNFWMYYMYLIFEVVHLFIGGSG